MQQNNSMQQGYPMQQGTGMQQGGQMQPGGGLQQGGGMQQGVPVQMNQMQQQHTTGQTHNKKVIAVIGATGKQGCGLVDAILSDKTGDFACRAITRRLHTDKVKDLEKRGAEVVFGDLDDRESLVRAFQGCYGAFVVTNFWEHGSGERELQQARNAADAARMSNLQHIVWSSLEDTRTVIPQDNNNIPWIGKFRVPHFDAKGEANKFFINSGVPCTIVDTSFYWDNFFSLTKLQKHGDGLLLMLPMGLKRLPAIASEDIGHCVYGIFKNRDLYIGKQIGIAGEHLTGEEIATVISKRTGMKVTYTSPTVGEFSRMGFPGAQEFANMFHVFQDYNDPLILHRDVNLTKKLYPNLQNFESFLVRHKADLNDICCP